MAVLDEAYPTTDAQWRARSDAQTLAQANLIQNDPARLSKAQTEAAKMAEHERQEANALSRVAGRKKSSDKSGTGDAPKRTVGTGSGPAVKSHNVFNRI